MEIGLWTMDREISDFRRKQDISNIFLKKTGQNGNSLENAIGHNGYPNHG